ncbi:uncharacterized protein LOC117522569 [Thalassophryne amazonica]|uniref:uncharacterized protein LOC117522569 n=1 Tax=Thalassophryne amazonica TaxID=390379 RepID=UPI0014719B3D|nr:uncharacterized protein LOC117522569 [Thalassophryne amazonica]
MRENSTVSRGRGEGYVHHGKLLIWQNVLQDAETEENKSTKGSPGDDAHYQSDMGWETEHFQGAGDDFSRPHGDAVERLLKMELNVECTRDAMKLHVQNAASAPGSLFSVDRGNYLSSLPLSTLPPSCGYTIRSTQTDLSLVAPYDGCFVTLEKDVYILPLLWCGVRLRMLCPLTHSSPNPPMVTCHAGGMVVKTDWTTPISKVKVNLKGQWEPLMKAASRCGFSVDVHPEGVVVSARYEPCLHKKDGMYTMSLTGDNETRISCPALSPTPSESVNSLGVGQFQQLSYTYHIGPAVAPSENLNGPTNLAVPHISGQQQEVPQSLPYFPFVPTHGQAYPQYPEMRGPPVANKHDLQSGQTFPTGRAKTPEEQIKWPLNHSPNYPWPAQQPVGPHNPEYAFLPTWPVLKHMATAGSPPVYQPEDDAKHPSVIDAQSEKIKDHFAKYSFYPQYEPSQKSEHIQNADIDGQNPHPLVQFPLYFGQPKPSMSESQKHTLYPQYYDSPKQSSPDSLLPGGLQQQPFPFNPPLIKPLVYESPQQELQQPLGQHLTDQFYPPVKTQGSHQEYSPPRPHPEVSKLDGPSDLSPEKSTSQETRTYQPLIPLPFYSQPHLPEVFQGQVHQTFYPYPYPFDQSSEKPIEPSFTEISKGQVHQSFHTPQPMIPGAVKSADMFDQHPGKDGVAHPPLFPLPLYTQQWHPGVPHSEVHKLVYPYHFDQSSEKYVMPPVTEISKGQVHQSSYSKQLTGDETNLKIPDQPTESATTQTLKGSEPETLPAGYKMQPQELTLTSKVQHQQSIMKQSKFGLDSQGLQPGTSYMPPVYCPQICPAGLSHCCIQIAFHQHHHYFFPPGPGSKDASPVYTGLPSLLGMTRSGLGYNLRSGPLTVNQTEMTNEQFHTTSSTPVPTESQYDWQTPDGNPATISESDPNKFTKPELSMHPYLVPHNLQYPSWPYQQGQLFPPVFKVPSEHAVHNENPMQEFESYKMHPLTQHYNELSSEDGNLPNYEQYMQPYFISDISHYRQSDEAKPQNKMSGEDLQPSLKKSSESEAEKLKQKSESSPSLIPYDPLQDDQASFHKLAVSKNSSQPESSVTDPKNTTHQQMVHSHFEPKGYVLFHRGPPSRKSGSSDYLFHSENSDHKRSNLLAHVLTKHHRSKSQGPENLKKPQGKMEHSKWMGKGSSEYLVEDENIRSSGNKETDVPLTFSATDGFYFGHLPEEPSFLPNLNPEFRESVKDVKIHNTPLGSSPRNPLQFSLKNLQ